MNEPKHIPGPWNSFTTISGLPIIRHGKTLLTHIAEIVLCPEGDEAWPKFKEREEATIRLMTKSPDMFKLLDRIATCGTAKYSLEEIETLVKEIREGNND